MFTPLPLYVCMYVCMYVCSMLIIRKTKGILQCVTMIWRCDIQGVHSKGHLDLCQLCTKQLILICLPLVLLLEHACVPYIHVACHI